MPPSLRSANDGTREFNERENAAEDEGDTEREMKNDLHHPPDLGNRDGDGIGKAGTAPGGILSCRAQPLKHEGDAHDHVAEHHDRVVEVFAVLDGGEQAWQADRQDQHADHLHHRDDPEDPVVCVIGRREPREIDPRPADAKAREAEAEQASRVVALRQRMRELGGREPEADHERQVEQQFEWSCDTVRLVSIASTHLPRVMVQRLGAGRCGAHAESPASQNAMTSGFLARSSLTAAAATRMLMAGRRVRQKAAGSGRRAFRMRPAAMSAASSTRSSAVSGTIFATGRCRSRTMISSTGSHSS